MNQFLLVCGKLIKKNIVLAWNNKNRFMILLLYIWHIFSNFIYLKAISSSTKNSETTPIYFEYYDESSCLKNMTVQLLFEMPFYAK